MIDARNKNSVTPRPPSPGVNATAADAPAPVLAAVATLSRDCASEAPSPVSSRVAGMSRVEANGGGNHEEVARLSNEQNEKLAACESTSLIAADLNVESFSCRETKSGIGSARATSAMLHPGVVDGSTTQLAGRDSGDRAERRPPNSDPVAGSQATVADAARAAAVAVATNSNPTLSSLPFGASANCAGASVSVLSSSRIPGDRDRQAVAEASTPDLKLPAAVDPSPCGFNLESEISALEEQWARAGISMNARTFAASVISDNISKSSA
jgi:hypothetical protein